MKETIWGRNAVYEMLRANRRQVYKLLVAEGVQERGHLTDAIQIAQQRSIPIQRVKRPALDRITDSHQGILAEVSEYPYVGIDDMLDLAQTAQRAAVDSAPRRDSESAEPGHPAAHRRSGGRARRHHSAAARRGSDAGRGQRLIRRERAYAHRAGGQPRRGDHGIERTRSLDHGLDNLPEARPLDQADLRGAIGLVVGNEGEGMRRLVRESCDFLVKLPMRGQVDSLNAAVAGSIVLYEILRQRMQNARRTRLR